MSTLQFKTNLNCNSCVARVRKGLDENPKIKDWEVDLDNPNKLLSVSGDDLTSDDVISTVERFGFDIEAV